MHSQDHSTNRRVAGKLQLKGRPAKVRRWNHQEELEALKGKQITLKLDSGDFAEGVLVAADQFSIQIKSARNRLFTYYKSALIYYTGSSEV